MDKKLKYCIGIAAVYAEILFIIAISTNVELLSPIFNIDTFLIIPNTVAGVVGIPFYILGLGNILDIFPLEAVKRTIS